MPKPEADGNENARPDVETTPTVSSLPLRVILTTAEEVLRRKNFNIAERLFEEALRKKAYSIRGLSGIGCVFLESNKPKKAAEYFFRLLIYRPGFPSAAARMGHACSFLDDFSGAEKWYRRAVAVDPSDRAIRIALGITLLRLGKWDEGFRFYDLREGVASLVESIGAEKVWDGHSDILGRRVLVIGEQGNGDHIQFMRYCALLKERGAYVIFFTREPIKDLCGWMAAIDEVVVKDAKVSFDFAVMAMSLPGIFGTEPDSVPMRSSYLTPPAGVYKSAARPPSGPTRIALAWKGNPQNSRDAIRSCPPDLFANLIRNSKDAEFFALPFDLATETQEQLTQLKPICEPDCSFVEVAERLVSFDLVITVDTALVHLAGALGIPAWLLIGRQPDWRWLASGETNIWYESVRLFRGSGEWSELVDRVKGELDHFLACPPLRNQ